MPGNIFLLLILITFTACDTYKIQVPIHNNTTDIKQQNNALKAFNNGNYAKAKDLYENLLITDQNNADYLFRYAESLRLSGNVNKALSQYNKLINSNRSVLYAMEGKGLAYVQNGQFKEAASLLSKVVDQDATRWRTINALGVIYSTTGHLEESLEYYNMALGVSKNNPSVLNNIALAVAFGGDLERGKRILEGALHNTKEGDIKKRQSIEMNIALINGLAGNMDKAENILNKYLTKPEVLNNLGLYATLAEDKKLAKTYLSKALSSSPVHYEKAWNNLQQINQ